MKLNNKKGFSLIELSIVLIIIGLLIAGITGGASLIKSAELRSVMSEIRNYQTAINAYYTATGSLPGTSTSSEMSFADTGYAWQNLFDEGITDSAPENGTSSASNITSDNGMTSRVKGGYYVLGHNANMGQNVIFLVSGTEDPAGLTGTASSTTVENPSITRKDAKFLDDKMDNGVIDSGKVWSFSSTGGSCAYSTTDTTRDCATAFGIGL